MVNVETMVDVKGEAKHESYKKLIQRLLNLENVVRKRTHI